MKTLYSISRLVILIFIIVFIAMGCGKENSSQNDFRLESYFIFDTFVSVKVFDHRITDKHFTEIESILENIDQKMNRQRENSEIYNVNSNAGSSSVSVSEETFFVIEKALEYAKISNGLFDPTIGPLVDLWGIGTDEARRPNDLEIKEIVSLVGYNDVELNEANLSIHLLKPGMSIDLGAISKGYAADQIALYLKEQDMNSAIIDLGGNILAMGSKPDGSSWTIGLQNPDDHRGTHIGTVKVNNKTIVASGVYERYYMEDGIRYHHILNPYLGYPVNNKILSVTIITELSMDADALSTAAFALGLEKGMKFIESLPEVEAIFITDDKVMKTTSGLSGKIDITNQEYILQTN